MAHSIFSHDNCSTIHCTDTVRLNALFCTRNGSDVKMRCLLRTNATSRKEIRASVFSACRPRRLGNSILSAKFLFVRLLASENDLYELGNISKRIIKKTQSCWLLLKCKNTRINDRNYPTWD